ncbi:hypothetical protein BACCELL_03797 [Bacteroides cellulosilyticus DSM 14838]|uniref:Uncharacterized protein n=1 Tax=Bacteroides cellulosilyticus DSM 14838 TaxID=537012 RepID=E2NHM0_9BACE|nr:hypothetical protein BACCELL_03797 [Bacteroides cellulosilyticus DSM 14838]
MFDAIEFPTIDERIRNLFNMIDWMRYLLSVSLDGDQEWYSIMK